MDRNIKAGEIFLAAGAAVTKLSELIMTLHSVEEPSSSSSKKDDPEQLDQELSIPVKSPVKRRSTEEPAIEVKKQNIATTTMESISQDKIRVLNAIISPPRNKSVDITLNMLNAVEPEVDIKGVSNNFVDDSSDDS